MSSDKIKDVLVAHFPGTLTRDWKRGSRLKVGLNIHRVFDHPHHAGVLTVEDQHGDVSIQSTTASITAMGKTLVREIEDTDAFVKQAARNVLKSADGFDKVRAGDRVSLPDGTVFWRYTGHAGGSLTQEQMVVGEGVEHTVVEIVGVSNFLSLTGPMPFARSCASSWQRIVEHSVNEGPLVRRSQLRK